MSASLADEAQRRAGSCDASVWVAASAGTGKTKVLTDRVLSLLLGGSDPTRILCLTFTRAAAAEMANRLHERLKRLGRRCRTAGSRKTCKAWCSERPTNRCFLARGPSSPACSMRRAA